MSKNFGAAGSIYIVTAVLLRILFNYDAAFKRVGNTKELFNLTNCLTMQLDANRTKPDKLSIGEKR